MNPTVFYILKWEKELENRRLSRVPRRADTASARPVLRSKREEHKRTQASPRHRRACECS